MSEVFAPSPRVEPATGSSNYTTTYSYHKKSKILQHNTKNLALLGRFIDNMLCIWTGPEEEWPHFKDSLQGFGKLVWICSDLSSSVHFLDITLSFTAENNITSCTYQKPLNLYLYIPPTSAHPSSCFTGTIVGNILRCWRQNYNLADYRRLVTEFAIHLESRGYAISDIERAMLSAATKIDAGSNTAVSNATPTTITVKRLYLHWRYSTHGPGRQTLRHHYNKHLRRHDGFDEMIVAFSRPKNLRDLLTHTVLNERPGGRMSDIITSSCHATKALREQKSTNPRTTTDSPNTPQLPPTPSIQV
jgi:hypothetical protein